MIIKILATTQNGQVLFEGDISSFPATIGRSAPAQIIIAHPMMSSKHATLVYENGFVEIRDLGSRNGLYFDGVKVPSKRIDRGYTFQIGSDILLDVLPTPVAALAATGLNSWAASDGSPENSVPIGPPTATKSMYPTKSSYVVSPSPASASVGLGYVRPGAMPMGRYVQDGDIFNSLQSASSQLIAFFTFIVAAVIGLLGSFGTANGWALVGLSLGAAAGVMIGSFLSGVVFAIPGWFFRGHYSLKPIYTALLLCSCGAMVHYNVCAAYAFLPKYGMMIRILGLAIYGPTAFLFVFVLLRGTFPESWKTGLLVTAFILISLAGYKECRSGLFPDRNIFLQQAFERADYKPITLTAGHFVTPSDIASDIQSAESEP